MKVSIMVQLCFVPDEDGEGLAAESHGRYEELFKDFELPFAPVPEMTIQFPLLSFDDAAARRFQELLQGPVVVSGVFRLVDVHYEIDPGRFTVTAYDGYETEEMLERAIELLVVGYGFERV